MIIGKTKQTNPILFHGVALIADKTNQLRLEILPASTTAYSYNPREKIEEVLFWILYFKLSDERKVEN